ncbi:PIN domain-containing protein [Flavobacterium mekongense]|uniref:PIN domain-containing protein n=1 Tax=Flavobacterium mekongense TaxID=3379707 RepID=UPI003999A8A2
MDTNVLLFPYKTSTKSLNELEKIYSDLIKQKRLIIPARVIREFGKNRGKNLAEIYKRLKQKENGLDRVETKTDFFPILENEKSYSDLQNFEKEIKDLVKKSRESLRELQNKVSNYNWDDPVSNLYKKIFDNEIIKEVAKSRDELISDLIFRVEHSIAPGYKDTQKTDKGIGDLIIWHTILEIGSSTKKDIIFVTDDSKNDWFYIEEKKTIYPKFELFDEFRRITEKNIQIIDVTLFLELQNASEETIEEVRQNKLEIQDEFHIEEWHNISHLEVKVGMMVKYGNNNNEDFGNVIDVQPHKSYDNIITLKMNKSKETINVAGKNFLWKVLR